MNWEVKGHALVAIPARTTKARVALECRECGERVSIALQETLGHAWSAECPAACTLVREMGLSPLRRGGRS